MEQSPLLPSKPSGSEQSVLLAFRALQTSWLRYWQDVSVFWESLMKCFATGGNWMALKTSCIQTGLDRVLAGRLSELRQALEDIGIASSCTKSGGELEVLSRTLLTLLSNAPTSQGQLDSMWNSKSSMSLTPRRQPLQSSSLQKQAILQKRGQLEEQERPSQGKPRPQGSLQSQEQRLDRPTQAAQAAKAAQLAKAAQAAKAAQVAQAQKRENSNAQAVPQSTDLVAEREVFKERQPQQPQRSERRHSLAVPSVPVPTNDFSDSNGHKGSLRQRSISPVRQRVVPQIALSLFKTLSKGVPQVLMVLKDPVDRGWCNQCTFTHLKSTHRFLTSGGKVMLVCKRLRKLTQKRHRNLASLVLDGELEWPCKDDTRRTDGPIPRNTISPVQVDKRTVYRIGDLNFSPQ